MKKTILPILLLLLRIAARGQTPAARQTDEVPAIVVSPGVILKELTGRNAEGSAKSERNSVAFFHLEPGRASAWSFNKLGEESFFILKGHGEIWTGGHAQAVSPGSFVLVPPSVVRSVRANRDEALEFYAVTTPAWSQEDDVLTTAPEGAPK